MIGNKNIHKSLLLLILVQAQLYKFPRVIIKKGEMVATRKAYGTAFALLGDTCDALVSLDAEVKNSTYAEIFESSSS